MSDHPFRHERYTRSNAYDPAWVIENQMGPNALWLTESLAEVMPIEAGAKVLDLGCGRAMSSIFLAREFGAKVWATDLWIRADANERRIEEAGVADLVTAVHAEAHSLPFDEGFFDMVVSLDAYHYFGTDDLYLGYLTDFVAPGGRIGAVVPALFEEVQYPVPDHLAPYWEWEYCSFHGPDWWRRHWDKTGKVRVDTADAVDDGWRDWLLFNDATAPHVTGWLAESARSTREMLLADEGRLLGFTRLAATKT